MNRRDFFKHAVSGIVQFIDEVRGHQHLELSAITSLTDDQIAVIIPKICAKIKLCNNETIAVFDNSPKEIKLFRLNSQKNSIFNMINGQNTLFDIAKTISKKNDSSFQENFEITKNFILDLILKRVCIPVNVGRP